MLAHILGAWLSVAGPEPASYDAQRATDDAKTILRDRGKAYLEARARLEANPELSSPALLATLEEPLGPAERRRVLSILSGFRNAELIPMFADLLRKAALAGSGMEPWRGILLEQGASSADALAGLVADRELPTEDRSKLLDDLVTVVPRERLAGLVGTLGRGHSELRAQLRRSLARRGKRDPADGAALRAALDEIIANGEPRQRAEATSVRAAVSAPGDRAFETALIESVTDESDEFVVRVASIRALAGREGTAVRDALGSVAETHLASARRDSQTSEILGWLALRSLPRAQAAPISDALGLANSDAPRLATIAYEVGSLPGGDWLSPSQTHPWPIVRAAALGRVKEPCERERVKRLSSIAGPVSGGGEREPIVARAAIVALGRCGDEDALGAIAKLLRNDGIGYEQRGEAARQLVERGSVEQVDDVAAMLVVSPPALAERLAGALSRATAPSDSVRDALCSTIRDVPNASATAKRSFERLFDDQRCPTD